MNPVQKPTLTPFFATKTLDRALIVRTGVRAGAREQQSKLREEAEK